MALTKEDLQAIGELIDSKLAPFDGRFTQIDNRFTQIDNRLTQMDNRLTQMDNRLAQMDDRLTQLEERVVQVAVTQEHDVLPRVKLLAEGDKALADRLARLEELPDQVEDIQTTVSVLKHVFKEHIHS